MRGKEASGLVFDDLGDAAHGALFDAIAASDAGVLVLNHHNAAGNLQDSLSTRVYADTAADAFIGLKNRMRHDTLL